MRSFFAWIRDFLFFFFCLDTKFCYALLFLFIRTRIVTWLNFFRRKNLPWNLKPRLVNPNYQRYTKSIYRVCIVLLSRTYLLKYDNTDGELFASWENAPQHNSHLPENWHDTLNYCTAQIAFFRTSVYHRITFFTSTFHHTDMYNYNTYRVNSHRRVYRVTSLHSIFHLTN